MKIDKIARISAALSIQQIGFYRCESGDETSDAERNLQGRTHYVDETTRRYFGSRILAAGRSKDNLLYWLVESVSSRPNAGRFTRRAVVFDVFGTVINERADMADKQGDWFADTDKAIKSARDFVAGFDAENHILAKLKDRAKADALRAKRTLAALAGKVII